MSQRETVISGICTRCKHHGTVIRIAALEPDTVCVKCYDNEYDGNDCQCLSCIERIEISRSVARWVLARTGSMKHARSLTISLDFDRTGDCQYIVTVNYADREVVHKALSELYRYLRRSSPKRIKLQVRQ